MVYFRRYFSINESKEERIRRSTCVRCVRCVRWVRMPSYLFFCGFSNGFWQVTAKISFMNRRLVLTVKFIVRDQYAFEIQPLVSRSFLDLANRRSEAVDDVRQHAPTGIK